MDVRTLRLGVLDTNCYILLSSQFELAQAECFIIDPGDDGSGLVLSALKELPPGTRVRGVLITHGHLDHTASAALLQRKTGAPVYIGAKDEHFLKDPGFMSVLMRWKGDELGEVHPLREGDHLALGETHFEVWETPGHSPGSLSFVARHGEGGKVFAVFSGDLIFKGAYGRTDLPGGDEDAMIASLRRVLSLPDEVIIYPGHGETTTIGLEKTAIHL